MLIFTLRTTERLSASCGERLKTWGNNYKWKTDQLLCLRIHRKRSRATAKSKLFRSKWMKFLSGRWLCKRKYTKLIVKTKTLLFSYSASNFYYQKAVIRAKTVHSLKRRSSSLNVKSKKTTKKSQCSGKILRAKLNKETNLSCCSSKR